MTALVFVELRCDGVADRGCPSRSTFQGDSRSVQTTRIHAREEGWDVFRTPDNRHHDICGECRG